MSIIETYRSLAYALPFKTILLFRVGDFYEVFDEMARTVAKILNLTITKRAGAPMAGIPYHGLEEYAKLLIGAGWKVAIAEDGGIKDAEEYFGVKYPTA